MATNTKRANNLGEDPVKTLVWRLAIPAMLAQFVNVLYSVVDRMYIGNIAQTGDLALAGVGICGPILTMLTAFACWVGIGGAPLMSISNGAGNIKRARQIIANAFMMLLVLAFALMILFYAVKTPLLHLFGATDTVFPYADRYMTCYLIGTPFVMIATGMNQFIIGQGYSGHGMTAVVIGAVLNLILDPIFIFALGMGVEGAAIATVLSQLTSCIFTLYVLFKPIPPLGITFGGYEKKLIGRILKTGFSPFAILLFDNVLIVLQNVCIKNYGGADSDLLLTCNTIVQSFFLIVTMPMGGITGGTQSILGYNYGAKNGQRVRDAVKAIITTTVIYGTIMFLTAQCGAELFAGMFTKNPLYIERCAKYIKICTLAVIPLAVQYPIVDGLTGMSITNIAFALSFTRKGIYVTSMLAFSICMGAEYLFWAQPLSDFTGAVISTITFTIMLPKILKRTVRI